MKHFHLPPFFNLHHSPHSHTFPQEFRCKKYVNYTNNFSKLDLPPQLTGLLPKQSAFPRLQLFYLLQLYNRPAVYTLL